MAIKGTLLVAVVAVTLMAGCQSSARVEGPGEPAQAAGAGGSLTAFPLGLRAGLTLADALAGQERAFTLHYQGVATVTDHWLDPMPAHVFLRERWDGQRRVNEWMEYHFAVDGGGLVSDRVVSWDHRQFWVDTGHGPLPMGPVAAAFLLVGLSPVEGTGANRWMTLGTHNFTFAEIAGLGPGRDGCRWHSVQSQPALRAELQYHACLGDGPRAREAAWQWINPANPDQTVTFVYATQQASSAVVESRPYAASNGLVPETRPWDVYEHPLGRIRVPPDVAEEHELRQIAGAVFQDPFFLTWIQNRAAYVMFSQWYTRWVNAGVGPQAFEMAPLLIADGRDRYFNFVYHNPGREGTPEAYFVASMGGVGEFVSIPPPKFAELPERLVPLGGALTFYGSLVPQRGQSGAVSWESGWFVHPKETGDRTPPIAAFWLVADACMRGTSATDARPEGGRPYFAASATTGQLLFEAKSQLLRDRCWQPLFRLNDDDGLPGPRMAEPGREAYGSACMPVASSLEWDGATPTLTWSSCGASITPLDPPSRRGPTTP